MFSPTSLRRTFFAWNSIARRHRKEFNKTDISRSRVSSLEKRFAKRFHKEFNMMASSNIFTSRGDNEQ